MHPRKLRRCISITIHAAVRAAVIPSDILAPCTLAERALSFILIILLGLCFGIINTMLMAVLERTKEIGMLMAIGMNKRRIFSMIILESVMLTVTGGIFGIGLGALITKFFETTPINLSMFSEGLESYGYAAVVYTSLKPEMLVIISILVVITGLLSAIYPARKALKLNPAEATRTD